MCEWLNRLCCIQSMENFSAVKRNHWHIQHAILEWISKELCWVKNANPKRLYTVWFPLYDIPKMIKESKMENKLGASRGLGGGSMKAAAEAIKIYLKESLWWQKSSVCWPHLSVSWLWYCTMIFTMYHGENR